MGANSGQMVANTSNQNIISKVRKTPSEFQLTSFLVVQNNLSQTIQNQPAHNDSNQMNVTTVKGRQAKQGTAAISPIK